MIKQTHRQIHFQEFIPYQKKQREFSETKPNATVSKKSNTIRFPGYTCKELGMIGHFVRFFFEPTRKIIGWRIYPESIALREMKKYKLCKLSVAGTFTVSIAPILHNIPGLKSEKYSSLEVKKYVDQTMLNKGDTYYYVQLKEPHETEDEE